MSQAMNKIIERIAKAIKWSRIKDVSSNERTGHQSDLDAASAALEAYESFSRTYQRRL